MEPRSIEDVTLGVGPRRVLTGIDELGFERGNGLSIGALSKQSALRLIDEVIPAALRGQRDTRAMHIGRFQVVVATCPVWLARRF